MCYVVILRFNGMVLMMMFLMYFVAAGLALIASITLWYVEVLQQRLARSQSKIERLEREIAGCEDDAFKLQSIADFHAKGRS